MCSSLPVFALTSMLVFAQSSAFATSGLDQQFGSAGVVLLGATPVSGLTIDRIYALAIQDDGKMVIGGHAPDLSGPGAGAELPAIGRLNADGTWDTSFGDHGLIVLPYGAASA